MRLTTKGRYAVAALADIVNQSTEVVPLTDISERQDISISYLEQLFAKLRKKALVESVRGANGGYRIAKPLHTISIKQVIEAVEEDISATKCSGEPSCLGGNKCLTHDLWNGLTENIATYLASKTLQDLQFTQQNTAIPSIIKTVSIS